MVDRDLAIAGVGHAAYDEMLLIAGGILLGIAILGALCISFLKRRRFIAIFSGLAAVVGIGCLIASARVCMIWDGGFSEAEVRLTFVDEEGNPVRGVELRVEDKLGRLFYHYPVTDYLPGGRNHALPDHYAAFLKKLIENGIPLGTMGSGLASRVSA